MARRSLRTYASSTRHTSRETSENRYLKIRKRIAVQQASREDVHDQRVLEELMTDINVFTNLRQQGRNFAERAVMVLFAGLTVLLALLVRPTGTTDPAAAFTNDVVAMVIAAAFCFLVFDMIDKRRETDAPVVRKVSRDTQGKNAQPPGWRLEQLSLRRSRGPPLDSRTARLRGVRRFLGDPLSQVARIVNFRPVPGDPDEAGTFIDPVAL